MVFANVCKYCEEKKISIAAFEKMCEIGNGTISNWENDYMKPTLKTLEKMEQATGIPIAEWIK